jgi:hypothetical protein
VGGTAHRLVLSDRGGDGGRGGEPGVDVYRGVVPCAASGRHGFSVRLLPCTRGLAANPFETRLIRWWGDPAAAPLVAAPV